ncbi:MAG: immunoglobulin domain-containing protein [Acidobacteria bacterium]|nr:immunoglobulin domain-containing protein [Acidobacteriota bacterium]
MRMVVRRLGILAGALSLFLAGCGGGTTSPGPPPTVAPAITTQPQDQTVNSGQSATFTVTVTGTSPRIQWRRENASEPGVVRDVPGATAATYTTPLTNVNDHMARFSATATNDAGSATSTAAVLRVNEKPWILNQPSSLSTREGDPASFTVAAQGTPTLRYQWKRGGAPISGATAATYTIAAAQRTDDGAQFTVVVSNDLGQVESNSVTLLVQSAVAPPQITQQPMDQYVNIGQTANFAVSVLGTAPFNYQWQKNQTNIPGAVQSSLPIPNVQASDAGRYRVVVSNAAGSATSLEATLTVNLTPPSIVTQPAETWAGTGSTATFTVAAAGSPPFAYQWMKNGTNLPGATQASYTTPVLALSDSGTLYSVRVTNPAGSVLSQNALLHVYLARTVTGSAGTVLKGPEGDGFLPANLATAQVQVFQPAGNLTYTLFPGSGGADGQFSIPGVPAGPFLAMITPAGGGPARGLWTTLEALDFRTYAIGRPSAVYPTGASLQVQVSANLSAPLLRYELYLPSLGRVRPFSEPNITFNWSGIPLVQSGLDPVWVTALRRDVSGTETRTTIQGVRELPPFTMPDFVATLVRPDLVAPLADFTDRFQVDLDAYAALLNQVHSSLSPVDRGPARLSLRVQPYGAEIGLIPDWPTLLEIETTQTGTYDSTPFPYPDPFPALWSRGLHLQIPFTVSLVLPGAEVLPVTDALEESWPKESLPASPLSPRIRPVQGPRVNGSSIWIPPASVGTSPIFDWSPAEGDNPSLYELTLFEVDQAAKKLVERATLTTSVPSLIMPPALMKTGSVYVVRIRSVWIANFNPANPLRPYWPQASTPVYSNALKP